MKGIHQGIYGVILLEVVALLALIIKWIIAYGFTFRISMEVL